MGENSRQRGHRRCAVSRAGRRLRSATAIEYHDRRLSYRELLYRVDRVGAVLASYGLTRGARVALLSPNRPEYLEVELAGANLGVITACLNGRLSPRELSNCIDLVSPNLLIVEPDLATNVGAAADSVRTISLGQEYERLITAHTGTAPPITAEPEDGLVILYTSGTTGLPKGAIISHRAMVARALVYTSELCISPDDAFVAWAPMFHMASTDHALATLLRGGTVVMIDGFRVELLLAAVATHRIGWLVLIPGMIDAFAEALRLQRTVPKRISLCGGGRMPSAKSSWSIRWTRRWRQENRASSPCAGRRCSQADETNAHDFRGGWFHMGDVFRRNEDGTLDFVDRSKYLIKSGGENVYPAETERVLLSDTRISEAAVVRALDSRWGETPVAFVACRDGSVTGSELAALCRRNLASYKLPREFRFLTFGEFPRSTSGKVQRHELEARLARERK
jgi:acyl-CoA synthetase (AMP-forming)/AMP-acid ligase II